MKSNRMLVILLLGLSQQPASVFVESSSSKPKMGGSKADLSGIQIAIHSIEQKVDHFNDSDPRKWQMRYLVRSDFFKARNGPIFMGITYEDLHEDKLIWGHFVDIAHWKHALLIEIEHRYYGQSQPTNFTKENYKYFNVQQTLADMAHLIRTLKATVPGLANSKVILAGGSYPGALLVWFKKLYPDLMDGGWSSSAPLLAKVDFKEFAENEGRAYRSVGGRQCYERLQRGIAQLEAEIVGPNSSALKTALNLCDSFDETNELDVWNFFSLLREEFPSYNENGSDIILNTCHKLLNYSDDLSAVLAFKPTHYRNGSKSSCNCFDASFESAVAYFADPAYDFMRRWWFQTCNEFGFFQTSSSTAQPFGTKFPLKYFITLCSRAFGAEYSNAYIHRKVNQTNTLFGGRSPEVQNIYFTQGAWDPWITLGLNESKGAVVIPNASHCVDLYSISQLDSDEMIQSKLKVALLMQQWVNG